MTITSVTSHATDVMPSSSSSSASETPCNCAQEGNAEFAGVDIAGVDNAAPCGKGGQCRSGQCRSGEMRVKMCNIVMTGKESMAFTVDNMHCRRFVT